MCTNVTLYARIISEFTVITLKYGRNARATRGAKLKHNSLEKNHSVITFLGLAFVILITSELKLPSKSSTFKVNERRKR